jgi:type IV fimbrial biogenesis protein FimT
MRAQRNQAGFTLIELMVVLMIVAVTLVLAGPGFNDANLNTRLKAYSNALVSSVYLARGEAIKRNVPMRVCVSTDGSTCAGSGDWEQGWVVLDPNDVVIEQQQPLSDGFRMTSTGGHTLTFQPSGVASTPTTLKICRQVPEVGNQERVVTISATGRPNVTRTTTSTCT